MNICDVFSFEKQNRKFIGKRARIIATVCVSALALMFVLMLAVTYLQAFLFSHTNIYDSTTLSYILDIAFYTVYIGAPFGLASLILKRINKSTEIFQPKRRAPKYGLLYITGAIGAGYALNLLISLLFPSFVAYFSSGAAITADNPLDVVLCVIMTALLPAFLEEWAFRGVLLKNLLPYGRGGAIIISSVLFGIAHIDPPRIIFATALGLLLGLAYEYTGSLIIPMTIHFINNSLSVIVTLMPEGSAFILIFGFLMFCFIGCGIAAIIVYSIKGIKKNNVTLAKQHNAGYTLSAGSYASRIFLNFATIPLIFIYSYILILSYFPKVLTYFMNL